MLEKGWSPKEQADSRCRFLGRMQKMLRTVTKVERYQFYADDDDVRIAMGMF